MDEKKKEEVFHKLFSADKRLFTIFEKMLRKILKIFGKCTLKVRTSYGKNFADCAKTSKKYRKNFHNF